MKTRLIPRFISSALGLGLARLSLCAAYATTYPVSTTADFTNLPALAAGDTVVVHNGVYANVNKTLTGSGTAGNPVLVYAETIGGVAFSGSTSITVAGSYVTFAGFKFDGDTAAGGSPSTNKSSILQLASGSDHCTVTNCMIRNYDANAIAGNTYYWFMIRGYNHTIEYNSIEGKTTIGASIVFDMPEGLATKATARNHLFRFNYMGPRPVIGANGYEGLRVGVSTLQGYNLASIFEFNYFYRTIYGSGEPEAISNKSSNNTYRYNTFEEVRGQLCLRQGDGCIVEGNFFFGAGLSDAGGVRVIGQNHIVRNNYFQDVDGSGTTSAVVLYKGDVSWPASDDSSGYEAPDNAKIFHNTFVNCAQPIYLGGGSSTKEPTGVEVRNNVVQSAASDGAVFVLGMSASAISFSGDLVYHPGGDYGVTGISGVTYGTNPNLSFDATLGYYVPSSGSAVVDAAANTSPGTSFDVRGLARPSSGKDIGSYEVQAAGTGLGPMQRGDVGPAYYGGPANTYIPPGSTVAAPGFSPVGGTYTSAQSVTLSTSTTGATIRYTIDGSTPTQVNGTIYSSAITVAATTTVKALAYKSGYSDSAVTSATYTIQTNIPVANPAGGTYTSVQSVTLTSATTGATIRYTIDGSTPTQVNGTVYSSTITIGATTTLKAIAYKTGLNDSAVTSATYTINLPAAAAPAVSPAGGTYTSAQSVTLTSATSGATIRYTIDGSTPTQVNGTVYSSAIAIGATTTVKALAYKSGYSDSAVTSAIYTIDDGGVTVTVANGFVNQAFTSQAGSFSVDFDATPSISPSNTTLSLCQGAQTAYTGLACMVRFNTTGNIDARNGGVFAAASTIPFSAGTKYHFRFDVNVPAHTYSVTVTPAGGSATTVGANYAFRTEQAGVTALDNFNIDVNATPGGSVIVSPAVVVAIPAVAAPVFSPAGGTYTSTQSVTITSATSGATIRYTTNGTTPSQSNGTVYSSAVSIAATTTLKAIAYKSGQPDSSITTATYTITSPTPAKFTIPGTSVTASADDGNVPANTVDGSLATRWSALGDGQWIQYDLGTTKTVSYVRVAWLNGDTRTSTFDVQLSVNGTTWTPVLTGAQNPATTALSTYDFTDASARYVRIVGHGNSVNPWNSITETEVWGF